MFEIDGIDADAESRRVRIGVCPDHPDALPDVLGAHAGSIRVTHTLRPMGVAMAGRDVYDPYKD